MKLNKIVIGGLISAMVMTVAVSQADAASFLSELHGNIDSHGPVKEADNSRPNHVRHIIVVTSINGSTITGTNAFGNGTIIVNTSSSTVFVSRIGATSSLGSIAVGDTLSLHGAMGPAFASPVSGGPITVHAARVRDWGDVNIQNKTALTGKIVSIDDSNYQLVLNTSDGQQITVSTSNHPKVGMASSTGSSTRSSFGDLTEGMTIRVKGFWNSLANAVTAFKIKILK